MKRRKLTVPDPADTAILSPRSGHAHVAHHVHSAAGARTYSTNPSVQGVMSLELMTCIHGVKNNLKMVCLFVFVTQILYLYCRMFNVARAKITVTALNRFHNNWIIPSMHVRVGYHAVQCSAVYSIYFRHARECMVIIHARRCIHASRV